MEFMSRGTRPGQTGPQPATNAPSPISSPVVSDISSKYKNTGLNSFSIANVILMFSVTILMLAIVGSLSFGKPTSSNITSSGISSNSELQNVDTDKMQAVFLNGGQVYFGKITTLNPSFMKVEDIYYLRVNQAVQPNGQQQASNPELVKLGCELHGPTDEMVINREQVIFWENLKDEGQVAKAVDEYKKANPDGQKCAQPQAQTPPTPTPAPAPTPTTPRR